MDKLVRIIHPGPGDEPDLISDVPASSLPFHVRAGWALLDETPEPPAEETPRSVRRKKQAAAQQDAGGQDAVAQGDTNQEGE